MPPDADEKAIEIIAEECVAYFPRETSHALVLGEFTFTVELVRRLQARGITCLAATSTRNVEEDVEGQRVSAFTFVRFRPYPEPRSAQMPHGPTWLRGSTKESALDQAIEDQPDGSVIVRFRAGGALEMSWHLYTWGDAVEVVEPKDFWSRLERMGPPAHSGDV